MKKIIQITEENYEQILKSFNYKLKNKFIIFVSKNPYVNKEITIFYCFKQNSKDIRKSNHNIFGKFIRYEKILEYKNAIHIYGFLESNKVFIF